MQCPHDSRQRRMAPTATEGRNTPYAKSPDLTGCHASTVYLYLTGLLFFVLLLTSPARSLALTAGPNNPTTSADNAGVGSVTWSNTGNIIAIDNVYSTANVNSTSTTSHYLFATGFNLNIPTNSIITGIEVSIERKASQTSSVQDNIVRLVKAGAVTGSDYATATFWPTTDTVATYGGTSDLWGTTWTPVEVNDANFGVAISAIRTANTPTVSIDGITITVSYIPNLSLTTSAAVPSAGAGNAGTGSVAWTNPGNVTSSDNVHATAALNSTNTTSQYLFATGFNHGIPADAVVNGITVTVERKASQSSSARDNIVRLLKAGAVAGSNYGTTTSYTTSDVVAIYGGANDLWGASWTAAEVNAANFGVALSAIRTANSPTVSIDNITVTVTYTPASNTGANSPSAGAGNAGTGSVSWTNPGNVTSSDNVHATAALNSTNTTSQYLFATGFILGIPADAVVNGITVTVERKASQSSSARDNIVRLLKAGAVAGSNYGTTTSYTTSDVVATYGGANDLWGDTWTAAEVNAANFGVALSAIRTANSPTVSIDNITVTINYSTGDTLTANANTAIESTNPLECATGLLMQRFQVTSDSANDGALEIRSLTLDDTGTATSIGYAKVYIDTTSATTLPGTAVLLGGVAGWNGTSTAIPLDQGTVADRTVINGTPKYIYIAYDLSYNAGQVGRTLRSSVTALDVVPWDNGVTGAVGASNTLTVAGDPDPSTITIASGQTANGTPYNVSSLVSLTGDVGSLLYKVTRTTAGTPTAKTYYGDLDSPGIDMGTDGTTNITGTGLTLTVTQGGTKAGMIYGDHSTAPTSTTRTRIAPGAAVTWTNQEYYRLYTPTYGNGATIAASASVRADYYMRTTGTSATAIAYLYEYNDATGLVGGPKGNFSAAANASSTSRQTLSGNFNNTQFTVSAGNRLVVIFSFTTNNCEPAYLVAGAASATPSGYGSLTVTETVDLSTTCTDWTATNQAPATTAGGSLCGDYTDGGTYTISARGTDPDCGAVVTSSPASRNFTWNACSDPDPATLSITNPVNGGTASGTVTVQVQVSGEGTPSAMTNMRLSIPAGAGGTAVTNAAMSWHSASSTWRYSWNSQATHPGSTSSAATNQTISIAGNDPNCGTATTTQLTNITVNNRNGTTPGTASAIVSGPTSIVVSMPYAADVNGNNSYTVDYRLTGAGSWTNWRTAAPHTASPYATTITGLTPLASYEVRMTYNDVDGVNGTNPQTVTDIVMPSNPTVAGTATATALDHATIAITMPYSEDHNDNNTYTVDYRLTGAGSWTNWVTAAPHAASPYTTNITGLTALTSYDVRVTYNDADGVFDINPQTINGVTTQAMDLGPPAAVANLAVATFGADTLYLTWTAPGDDGNIAGGSATSYDIRYSKSAITDGATWANASQATDEPAPRVQGGSESFHLSGLESNTTYYVVIKATDELGKISDLSNQPSGKTGLLAGWNMIACPVTPSPTDSATVFADDTGYNWFFRWVPTGATNPDTSGYWEQVYTITRGEGLLAYSMVSFNATDAAGTTNTAATTTLTLQAGYNLIGNPYSATLSVSGIQVKNGASTVTFAQAVTNGWVGNAVYLWDGSTHLSTHYATAILEPWKAYYLLANVAVELIVTKPY